MAFAQFLIPATVTSILICPGRGFIIVPSFNFVPEGFKPFLTIDSKNLNLVPCQTGIQFLYMFIKL